MKDQNLLNEYIENLKIKGHRPRGIIKLKHGVKKFLEYIEINDLNLKAFRVNEAENYQGYIIEKGSKNESKYSVSSINHYVLSASSFFKFLNENGYIFSNPFHYLRRVTSEFKLPKNILKEKEMNTLLNNLSKYDEKKDLKSMKTKYRVYVISELMYATGLRISEVANLKTVDIDFDKSLVKVNEGKKGVTRYCILGEYAKDILEIYINNMRNLILGEWNVNSDKIFGSGYEYLNKLVNKVLKNECKKLNLSYQTSHGFRHALGFHLLRSGCDIRYIQALLGHKRLKDTEIYTKVDKEDLKEIFNKYHPRTFKKGEKNEEVNTSFDRKVI